MCPRQFLGTAASRGHAQPVCRSRPVDGSDRCCACRVEATAPRVIRSTRVRVSTASVAAVNPRVATKKPLEGRRRMARAGRSRHHARRTTGSARRRRFVSPPSLPQKRLFARRRRVWRPTTGAQVLVLLVTGGHLPRVAWLWVNRPPFGRFAGPKKTPSALVSGEGVLVTRRIHRVTSW